MKTVLILSFLVYFWGNVQAVNPEFETVVLETVDQLHRAETLASAQSCADRLERIATAHPKRWEGYYYLAYARITLSFRVSGGDHKDAILDQADADIKRALELGGDDSELNALQAYVYQGRIAVNGMRGMKYSGMAAEALEKAIRQNPSNGRAHFLLGMNVYHTPAMFGGGAKNALAHFEKAMSCFGDSVERTLAPHWGKEITLSMIERCKQSE